MKRVRALFAWGGLALWLGLPGDTHWGGFSAGARMETAKPGNTACGQAARGIAERVTDPGRVASSQRRLSLPARAGAAALKRSVASGRGESKRPGALNFEARVDFQLRIEEALSGGSSISASLAVKAFRRERAEETVRDYLRKNEGLQRLWGRAITGEELGMELRRLAGETEAGRWRRVMGVVGNDPLVAAECLARPALVDRLIEQSYYWDKRLHGELRQRAEREIQAAGNASGMRSLSGEYGEEEWPRGSWEVTLARVARGRLAPLLEQRERIRAGAPGKRPLTSWEGPIERLRRELGLGEEGRFDKATPLSNVGALPVGLLSALQEERECFRVTSVLEAQPNRVRAAEVRWGKQPFEEWWRQARLEFAGGETVGFASTGDLGFSDADWALIARMDESVPHSAAPACPVLAGRWGFGPTYAVAVSNNFAYFGSGTILMVADVSNPSSSQVVGSLDVKGVVQGIAVGGSWAYVAAYKAGLRVINVSNPAAPTEVGFYDTPGYAHGVAVAGSYAYIADGTSGLRVINISAPSLPTEVGFFDTSGSAYGVAVMGHYAYVADYDQGLRVINVSTPAMPAEVGFIDTADDTYGVAVMGDYAYVADWGKGLRVINISTPSSPVEAGFLDTAGSACGVAVSGGYAYVADYGGLRLLRVSDPVSLTETGFLRTAGYASDVAVSGDYAYVADWDGLRVIDVSTPASPAEVSFLDLPVGAFGVAVANHYAYVADGQGVRVIDVSDPASPAAVGFCDTLGFPWDVVVSGNYAYVAAWYSGLRVIDISNPASPVEAGYYNWGYQCQLNDVAASGSYAYLADIELGDSLSGLRAINVSDPSHPVGASFFPTPDLAQGVGVSGSLVCLANGEDVRVIDVSDPESPTERGIFRTPGYAVSVAVSHDCAYVGDVEGLRVVDVSNPSSPVESGFLETAGFAWDVALSGNYAYVADGPAGLSIISICSGPTTSREVRLVSTSGLAGGTATAPVEMAAQGDENAVRFSLTFDPAVLSNPQAALGSGAAGATLNTNVSQAASGRFGLTLSLPAGQIFSAGTKEIAVVTFKIAASAPAGSTTVRFGDQPVARSLSDVQANPLDVTWTPGAVTVSPCVKPAIMTHPQSQTVPYGQTATLSVTATGTAPLSYQWWEWGPNNTSKAIPGATGSTYQTPALTKTTGCFVRVKNSCGEVQSTVATVTVTVVDLSMAKALSGSLVGGAIGTYTLTVRSVGTGATAGEITVTDTLPTGLSFVSGSGSDWTCPPDGQAGQIVTCKRTATLAAGASTMITMQVAVGAAAPPQVTNSATVATPGDNNPGNNSASLTSPVTPQPSHVVRIAPTSGPQNGTAQAPIELVAQGDENALSFSLTFDQTVLTYQQGELGSGAAGATLNINDSQKASGKLGAALTLPAGQSFTGGTKQIVLVTFDIAPSATPDSTSVDFGDQPVARGISNVQAIPLPATWTAGTVTITCGLEGDVTPRPYGNGLITTTDWVQLGRFAAGLNTPATECEFQRADCAPRFILGNGAITTADWVQVGRYAAGLDPLTPAGGPTAPTAAGAATAMTRLQTVTVQPTVAEGGRNLMVEDVRIGRGQSGRVRIHLQAQGDENALGFSLRFDPRSLSLEGAEPGAGTSGALLTVNDRAKADGRLGVLLGLPAGRVFATGRQEVLVLSFQAKEAAATSTVEFMEGPVRLEISDAAGNALPAEYQGGRAEVRPGTSRRR